MQFKLLALSALAAAVSAQSSSTGLNQASVYSVLATALPSSLLAEALTNSAAVSSEIASEFRAGITPSWFAALPTPIQTYLLGQGSSANASAVLNSTVVGNSTSHPKTTHAKTTHKMTTHITGGAHHTTGGNTNTNTAGAASSSPAGSSSSSSGGASAPTGVIGAGLAGAVGLVGLLAL